ncbi:hypothetical protein RHGRI_032894 [Rhododendron griersonianum]|uniref:Copine C-terminal domain-containing protein n=1 Tax=Rhododendron griersonianum TaxID=479676 RepID=A0AAV6IFU1_9ERIC|nr:hypothetical protein RHGRI_032894 [Rhododendron griersonianum]
MGFIPSQLSGHQLQDGVITDLQETKDALAMASDLPLSILIVGVGGQILKRWRIKLLQICPAKFETVLVTRPDIFDAGVTSQVKSPSDPSQGHITEVLLVHCVSMILPARIVPICAAMRLGKKNLVPVYFDLGPDDCLVRDMVERRGELWEKHGGELWLLYGGLEKEWKDTVSALSRVDEWKLFS